MFIRAQGKTKTMALGVTPSTAIANGALVAFSSGLLIAATSTTAPSAIVGVLRKAIVSTDSDYASSRKVLVEVPVEKNVVWEADFTATLVTTDVGAFADLTDSLTVNRGASTYDVAQIIGYLSATKGYVILNIGADGIAGK